MVGSTISAEPAMADRPGGWPYVIRQDRPVATGDCPSHLATGIRRLADARLMAAASDLADTLFQLLTSPGLLRRGVDSETRAVIVLA